MLVKSGEYSGRILRLMVEFLEIPVESLAKETGFTESAIENFLLSDVLPKDYGMRLLTAMRLTDSDYSWFHLVLNEIGQARNERITKLENMKKQLIMSERKIKYEYEAKEREEQRKRLEAQQSSSEDLKRKSVCKKPSPKSTAAESTTQNKPKKRKIVPKRKR